MIRSAVTAYAHRFDARYATRHGVTSPLGAWLLLALVAPLAEGPARAELEQVLDLPADRAAASAAEMLATTPAAVTAAAAVWADVERLLPTFAAWTLPDAVERGPLPTSEAADAWAREHSRGLIERFPLTLDADTRLVLASVLATRITWALPLEEVPATELGGEFARRVDSALRLASGPSWQGVVDTEAAGPVGVAMPVSEDGLQVLSVIAAPDVAPDRVHRAAHEVAAAPFAPQTYDATTDGHAWSVTTRIEQRVPRDEPIYEWRSTLPAWRTTSEHDLADAPGVRTALDVLGRFVRPVDRPVRTEARQVATAAYSREGFEAAAVTAFGVRAAGAPRPMSEVTVHEVHLRFNRPHAVLARVADRTSPWSDGPEIPTVWAGVPVFTAWLAEP